MKITKETVCPNCGWYRPKSIFDMEKEACIEAHAELCTNTLDAQRIRLESSKYFDGCCMFEDKKFVSGEERCKHWEKRPVERSGPVSSHWKSLWRFLKKPL